MIQLQKLRSEKLKDPLSKWPFRIGDENPFVDVVSIKVIVRAGVVVHLRV
jgi:hypothetical protein